MDILFLLVPMSVMLALLVIAVFAWALNAGQFDDIESEGARILLDPDQTTASGVDAHQVAAAIPPEQSARRTDSQRERR
jgi:cbb3-type cytochrome oxidase maturation protein